MVIGQPRVADDALAILREEVVLRQVGDDDVQLVPGVLAQQHGALGHDLILRDPPLDVVDLAGEGLGLGREVLGPDVRRDDQGEVGHAVVPQGDGPRQVQDLVADDQDDGVDDHERPGHRVGADVAHDAALLDVDGDVTTSGVVLLADLALEGVPLLPDTDRDDPGHDERTCPEPPEGVHGQAGVAVVGHVQEHELQDDGQGERDVLTH